MNRTEFAKAYIVAVYREHRRQAPRRSIKQLVKLYDLPRDAYMEGEVVEYMTSQHWVAIDASSPVPDGLAITPNGKIAAELFIDQGADPGYLGEADIVFSGSVVLDVPASDRIVSINDNQITSAEVPLTELIRQVEENNGLPDVPTFRQRIIGQLKAGRELIRCGEVKWAILQMTLFTALQEIADRYKDNIIGSLAATLLIELGKLALV